MNHNSLGKSPSGSPAGTDNYSVVFVLCIAPLQTRRPKGNVREAAKKVILNGGGGKGRAIKE